MNRRSSFAVMQRPLDFASPARPGRSRSSYRERAPRPHPGQPRRPQHAAALGPSTTSSSASMQRDRRPRGRRELLAEELQCAEPPRRRRPVPAHPAEDPRELRLRFKPPRPRPSPGDRPAGLREHRGRPPIGPPGTVKSRSRHRPRIAAVKAADASTATPSPELVDALGKARREDRVADKLRLHPHRPARRRRDRRPQGRSTPIRSPTWVNAASGVAPCQPRLRRVVVTCSAPAGVARDGLAA